MPPTNQTTIARQRQLGSLGRLLAEKRREQQMSLTRLSERTGLTMSYLSRLERGDFQDIGVEKFCRIVETLGLSADEVLVESKYLQPPTKPSQRPRKGQPT
jgi:cytoskeletal protein RodZ